jgi:hypothetical protein
MFIVVIYDKHSIDVYLLGLLHKHNNIFQCTNLEHIKIFPLIYGNIGTMTSALNCDLAHQ